MKYLLLIIISITSISMSQAQQHRLPIYKDKIPNSKKSTLEEQSTKTDSERISKVIEPAIEVYLPAKAHTTKQAVLICPGGGYQILAWDKEGTDIAKWLNGQGIAGIVLKYRLPEDESNIDPFKSPLMDAQKAMEIIRMNAEEWNINRDQVGVMGFSAGGHLASTLGTQFTAASKPNFMILIYPVITMKDDFTHQGSKFNLLGKNPSDDLVKQYSGELNVSLQTPPTFIIHSEDDGAVPVENSLQFYLALKQNKVPVEMHLLPIGGHGFGLAINRGRLSEWPNYLSSWLKSLR